LTIGTVLYVRLGQIVLFLLGMGAVWRCSYLFTRLVNEVNAKAAPSNRLGVFSSHYTWNQQIVWERHKADCPGSPTRKQLVRWAVVFVGLFFLNATAMLIFGPDKKG
jgi:hypothetical protein